MKQQLIKETTNETTGKEREIQESDHELKILDARLKVENKAFGMQDLKDYLREDFKYSVQALENMIMMEQQGNAQLKKELEILNYRKAVIESQFSDDELGS